MQMRRGAGARKHMSTKDIHENHEPAPPLGLGLSEGLGPLAQPSNDELRAALVAACAEDECAALRDDAKQALWALRERRSTWFDVDELELRKQIDAFFGLGAWHETWVMNSQRRLCEQYGAAVFGDLGPGGRGHVWATWNDGARMRFHITTPLRELHQRLSVARNRGTVDDDLRDLMTEVCGPNDEVEPPRAAKEQR
jgi:hypothetical protein